MKRVPCGRDVWKLTLTVFSIPRSTFTSFKMPPKKQEHRNSSLPWTQFDASFSLRNVVWSVSSLSREYPLLVRETISFSAFLFSFLVCSCCFLGGLCYTCVLFPLVIHFILLFLIMFCISPCRFRAQAFVLDIKRCNIKSLTIGSKTHVERRGDPEGAGRHQEEKCAEKPLVYHLGCIKVSSN